MPRAIAIVLLAIAGAAVATPATSAQTDAGVLVRVAGMSPWIDDDHRFTLNLRITNSSDQALQVTTRVSFHPPVLTRSELRAALDDGASTLPVALFEQTTRDPIRPGETRLVLVRREPSALPRDRGAYPVTIAVVTASGQETLRTVVPIFPPTEAPPVDLAWVMRIERPAIADVASLDQEGVDELDLDALASKLSVVGARPDAPVTLAPSPAFIDALDTLAKTGVDAAIPALSAFRRAARAAAEIATVPYAAVDLPALLTDGPPGDLLRQISVGRAAIERAAGVAATLSAVVPPRLSLDDASLDALVDLGVGGVLVDPAAVRGPPTEPDRLSPSLFGPTFAFPLGSAALPAALPDAAIDERLEVSTHGVLLGQAIVAESMGIWQELPGLADERAVVIAPERLPQAEAIKHALDGLAGAPWIRLQPLSDALLVPEDAGEPVPFVAQPPRARPYLSAAAEARSSLTVLEGIAVEGIDDQAELDRAILLAESDDWLTVPEDGVALARAVVERVDSVIGGIRVAPRRVTLTSRTGDAPLTIINRNPFVLRVRVRLSGTKVGFPAGETREIELAPGDNTIAFPVEARATGSFPVDVSVETPDGRRVLSTGRLILRSTAVSAVSLAIVAGSALVLLLAWVRRATKRTGARRHGATVHR